MVSFSNGLTISTYNFQSTVITSFAKFSAKTSFATTFNHGTLGVIFEVCCTNTLVLTRWRQTWSLKKKKERYVSSAIYYSSKVSFFLLFFLFIFLFQLKPFANQISSSYSFSDFSVLIRILFVSSFLYFFRCFFLSLLS